ncbi:MAG: hypothetical protein Q9M19_08225, partial [Mariprofundaceae bacterium]|nr:hypothetical protein [Mariprofundaceae bacterium]
MMPLHSNQDSESISNILHQVLHDMDACVTAQERIIMEERAAMKVFDGNKLAALVEQRARCQSELGELESVCQRLILLADVGDKFEALIDTYAADDADALQSQRIELSRRMQHLEQEHIENHIRLR